MLTANHPSPQGDHPARPGDGHHRYSHPQPQAQEGPVPRPQGSQEDRPWPEEGLPERPERRPQGIQPALNGVEAAFQGENRQCQHPRIAPRTSPPEEHVTGPQGEAGEDQGTKALEPSRTPSLQQEQQGGPDDAGLVGEDGRQIGPEGEEGMTPPRRSTRPEGEGSGAQHPEERQAVHRSHHEGDGLVGEGEQPEERRGAPRRGPRDVKPSQNRIERGDVYQINAQGEEMENRPLKPKHTPDEPEERHGKRPVVQEPLRALE